MHRTRFILGAALLVASASAQGCDNDNDSKNKEDAGHLRDGGEAEDAARGDASTDLSESEVAAVVKEANAGEIMQAEMVMDRLERDEVKSFAQLMIDDHTKAQNHAQELFDKKNIMPESNSTSRKVKADGQAVVDKLKAAPDEDIDRVYLQTQIKEHQNVLDLIDDTLLPSVDDSDFKHALQSMHSTVNLHLEKARALYEAFYEVDGGADGGTDAGADAGADAGSDASTDAAALGDAGADSGATSDAATAAGSRVRSKKRRR